MATFSGSANYAYFSNTPDQSGMSPALSGGCIGFGAAPGPTAPVSPTAPLSIDSSVIGTAGVQVLTREP